MTRSRFRFVLSERFMRTRSFAREKGSITSNNITKKWTIRSASGKMSSRHSRPSYVREYRFKSTRSSRRIFQDVLSCRLLARPIIYNVAESRASHRSIWPDQSARAGAPVTARTCRSLAITCRALRFLHWRIAKAVARSLTVAGLTNRR